MPGLGLVLGLGCACAWLRLRVRVCVCLNPALNACAGDPCPEAVTTRDGYWHLLLRQSDGAMFPLSTWYVLPSSLHLHLPLTPPSTLILNLTLILTLTLTLTFMLTLAPTPTPTPRYPKFQKQFTEAPQFSRLEDLEHYRMDNGKFR